MEQQNVEQQVTRGLGATPSTEQRTYPFPTEIISLPSKGLAYPETSPLSKGEITIKLMTAKEEDILTSANLVKKGIHLDKLLESVVVEPGVNVNDLLVGDKNAILFAARILGYGAEYPVEVTDKYGKKILTTINLSELKDKKVDETLFVKGKNAKGHVFIDGVNIIVVLFP